MKRKYTNPPYVEYVVAEGHYDETRKPITTIVLHSSASTEQGLINTFEGGTRMVSAHYGINNQGGILAFLEEYYTAYHSGNYDMNQKSIGIEHVDEGSTKKVHTDKQYETSIKLVADICTFYNIPIDDKHIIPHSSIVATACPNGLDVARIINGAKLLVTPPIMEDYKKMYKDEKKAHDIDNKNKDTEIDAHRKTIATQQVALDGHVADCNLKVQAGKDETTKHLLIDFDVKEQGYKDRIKELEAQATTPRPAVDKPLELRYKGKAWALKLDAIIKIATA